MLAHSRGRLYALGAASNQFHCQIFLHADNLSDSSAWPSPGSGVFWLPLPAARDASLRVFREPVPEKAVSGIPQSVPAEPVLPH